MIGTLVRRRVFALVTMGILAVFLWAATVVVDAADSRETMVLRFADARKIADRSNNFTEVSGLSLARDGGFWAVSDDTARLFSLDAKGNLHIRSSLDAETGMEGVALDLARERILAVREDTSEILAVSDDGRLTRHPVLAMDGASGLAAHFSPEDVNDGLEGITVNPDTGAVFMAKERGPRLLIEIGPDLDEVRRIVHLTGSTGFTSDQADDDHLDVSGLAWDSRRQGLWITSDTGKTIYFFDFDTMQAKGWALMYENSGKLRRVSNAEGVAVSVDGETIFVVTDDDRNSRLLTYEID